MDVGKRAVGGRAEEGDGVPEAAGRGRRGVRVPRKRFGGDERRRSSQRWRYVSDTRAKPETHKTFLQSTTRGQCHHTRREQTGYHTDKNHIWIFSGISSVTINRCYFAECVFALVHWWV